MDTVPILAIRTAPAQFWSTQSFSLPLLLSMSCNLTWQRENIYCWGKRRAPHFQGHLDFRHRDFDLVFFTKYFSSTYLRERIPTDLPRPLFSHTAAFFDESNSLSSPHVLILGGCSRLARNDVYILPLDSLTWNAIKLPWPSRSSSGCDEEVAAEAPHLFARHAMTLHGNALYVLGGGVLCFAFGNFFNPSAKLLIGKWYRFFFVTFTPKDLRDLSLKLSLEASVNL